MRVSTARFGKNWKSVKALRVPRPKTYFQTSILEYFGAEEAKNEPSEEEVAEEAPVAEADEAPAAEATGETSAEAESAE